MMIAVDRSGSVQRAGTGDAIRKALADFVLNTYAAGSLAFVEDRDVLGLGSFGGSWKLDFAPSTRFRSGHPNIATAIANLPFKDGVTNTSEALYQAYTYLRQFGKPRGLNVILLLTDGRPSAFTATFDVSRECSADGKKTGVVMATLGWTWPPDERHTQTVGLFSPDWTPRGDLAFIDGGHGCHFVDDMQGTPGSSFHLDAPTFPEMDAHGSFTTAPFYRLEHRNTYSPRDIRYASFNAADNMAAAIRSDPDLRPVLMVIGLKQPTVIEEPPDADWLARVANEAYTNSKGERIVQSGQTEGVFRMVTPATLGIGLQKAFEQILRNSEKGSYRR